MYDIFFAKITFMQLKCIYFISILNLVAIYEYIISMKTALL